MRERDRRRLLERRRAQQPGMAPHVVGDECAGRAVAQVTIEQDRLVQRQLAVELERDPLASLMTISASHCEV